MLLRESLNVLQMLPLVEGYVIIFEAIVYVLIIQLFSFFPLPSFFLSSFLKIII